MNQPPIIKELTEEILSNEIHYLGLQQKLEACKSFLVGLAELDLDKRDNRAYMQFDNGVAIGTTWAAWCMTEIMRTRQFMRGIFKAVESLHKDQTQSKPIKILYAGSGPFATLVLPLLTIYTPRDLQLILMEVNQGTIQHLKRVIKKLGIENYIEKIICTDASTCTLEHPEEIDILISETMQYGLVKEQQVPIMLNLVNQLREDVILIPQKIQIDLAFMNSSTHIWIESNGTKKYKWLKTLMDFDQPFIRLLLNQTEMSVIDLGTTPLHKKADEDYDKLVLLTSIQVFEDEWVTIDSSSLTMPRNLMNLDRLDTVKKEISLSYVIGEQPDYEYELI